MKSICFQCHMLPGEIKDYVCHASAKLGAVVSMQSSGGRRSAKGPLAGGDIEQGWRNLRSVSTVYLYASDEDAIAGREPLVINIGRDGKDFVEETQFTGGTNRERVFAKWRSMIAEVRKRVPQRGFVLSGTTALRSPDAKRCVSDGAARAHRDSGIRLALYGANEVVLNPAENAIEAGNRIAPREARERRP